MDLIDIIKPLSTDLFGYAGIQTWGNWGEESMLSTVVCGPRGLMFAGPIWLMKEPFSWFLYLKTRKLVHLQTSNWTEKKSSTLQESDWGKNLKTYAFC